MVEGSKIQSLDEGYQISNNRDLFFYCLDQTHTMNDPYLSHIGTSYRHSSLSIQLSAPHSIINTCLFVRVLSDHTGLTSMSESAGAGDHNWWPG